MINGISCGSLGDTFVGYFCYRLLVLVRNRDLGDYPQIFCKLFFIIPTGMFYPVVFKYLLFFVIDPSSSWLGEPDYGFIIQTGMKVDVL
jgi:hypothetical protein